MVIDLPSQFRYRGCRAHEQRPLRFACRFPTRVLRLCAGGVFLRPADSSRSSQRVVFNVECAHTAARDGVYVLSLCRRHIFALPPPRLKFYDAFFYFQ